MGAFIEGIDYTKNKWYNFFEEKYALIRLEDLKKYKTWKEAEEELGCTNGAIGYSVNTGGSAKGWHFLKYEVFKDYSNNPFLGKKPNKGASNKNKIMCVETGEVFNSIVELNRKLNHSLKYYINKGKKYRGKHYIRIKKEKIKINNESKKRQVKKNCKVLCVETGEVFNTQKEACDKYKILSSGISRAIKNKGECGGKHWEIFEDK